jgi:hypothetical protein
MKMRVRLILMLGGMGFWASAQTAANMQVVPSAFWRLSDTVGDLPSAHYLFSPRPGSFEINPNLRFNAAMNGNQHTFLLGPEYRLSLGNRFEINIWAMAGNMKRFALENPFKQPTDAPPPRYGILPSLPMERGFNGANGWGASIGGSIDYRLGDFMTLQPLQTEYLRIQVENSVRRDMRFSTGLRFSFGK